MQVPSTRVLLWTATICLSSVFERSVRELCAVKALYEPHVSAYYQDLEEGPRQDRIPYTPSLYDSVDEKLLAKYDGYSA